MIRTGLDLPLSLSMCERLATTLGPDLVRRRVFMENFGSSYGTTPPARLDAGELVAL
jgi:hypothetical protein